MDNKEQAFTTMVGKYKKTIYTVCYFFSKTRTKCRTTSRRY